jgi:hypothetical protein
MRDISFKDEAEKCRRLAVEYPEGKEGAFLLSVAKAFEALPQERTAVQARRQVFFAPN